MVSRETYCALSVSPLIQLWGTASNPNIEIDKIEDAKIPNKCTMVCYQRSDTSRSQDTHSQRRINKM